MKKLRILIVLVIFLSFTIVLPIQAQAKVDLVPIGLSESVIDVDVGYGHTLTASTSSNSGGTLSWSTSNSYVATVNASGYVFGQHTGTAVITATYTSASGISVSENCTVYVTVADGLYYMKNASSDLCFYTGGSAVSLQAQQTDASSRIGQLWKIRYVADGKYEICPIRDTSVALTANDGNYVIVGETETVASWGIMENANGYAIAYLGSSEETAKPVVASIPGTQINLGEWQDALTCHWELEPADGIFLRDMNTQTLTSDSADTILGIGKTCSLEDLGIALEYYGNVSSAMTWTSDDSSIVSVSAYGQLTGENQGVAKITVSAMISGMNYSYSCYVRAKSAVLVFSCTPDAWLNSSETMGQNLASEVGAEEWDVQAVFGDEFANLWNNTSSDFIIIHTHGSPEGLFNEPNSEGSFTLSDISKLERNSTIRYVLITACETGGQNGTNQNFASVLSQYIAEDGIVVCCTTAVEGIATDFIATNDGEWVAYLCGVQISCSLPTTITMALVADYWEGLR